MNLYLIRHGIAAERGTCPNDRHRPLTEKGKTKTRAIAQRLLQLDLQFDRLLTSPLTRAQETAQLLLEAGLSDRLDIADYLAPEGSLEDCLGDLHRLEAHGLEAHGLETHGLEAGDIAIALIGHEPDLSQWATRLMWGDLAQADQAPVEPLLLKKAGIIGLSLPTSGSALGQSQLFWLAPPRFLR